MAHGTVVPRRQVDRGALSEEAPGTLPGNALRLGVDDPQPQQCVTVSA